ncbi:hypothetical protein BLOT_013263 [Blomia tropicalis]|nr:hypothetical protein BLOT_013263 [Blomia tropicalis]
MIIHEQSLKCDCDKTKLKPNEFYKNRSTQSQTHVLIISEARSGSSFLGDLLQHVTLTYYSFEPLIGIDPGSPLYQSLIYDLFSCQFDHLSNSYLLPIYWKIQYLKWNSMLVKAIDQNDRLQLFNHTIHRWLCRNAETILVKTIRYTLPIYGNSRLKWRISSR